MEMYMKRVTALFVLILGVTVALAGQEADELIGDWTAFRAMDLSNFTLNDYRNPPDPGDLPEGVMTLNADGTIESNFLDFDEWEIEDNFLVMSDGNRSAFFVPRPMGPDTYYLLRVSVTQRDREVTHIRVDRPSSFIVVRGIQ